MKAAKIILAVIALILVVGSILFCLPKDADALLGGKEITEFSCIALQDVFTYDGEHASTRHDIWKAGYETNTEETLEKLTAILSSSRYRLMLKTLLRQTKFSWNGDYSIDLILVMSDDSTVFVDFIGNDLVILKGSSFNLLMHPTDKEVCARLAEYIKEIGQKQ